MLTSRSTKPVTQRFGRVLELLALLGVLPLLLGLGGLDVIDGWPGHLRTIDGQLKCVADAKDAKPQFTDGYSTDPLSGCRPGFRIPAVADRRATRDAYARYETSLVNRYKLRDGQVQCSACGGAGWIDDEQCDACGGAGYISDDGTEDRGSGNDSAQDHRANMDRLYRDYDAELSAAWRRR